MHACVPDTTACSCGWSGAGGRYWPVGVEAPLRIGVAAPLVGADGCQLIGCATLPCKILLHPCNILARTRM